MTGTVPGLMLVTIAGIANATFTLPMKFARHWAWENVWLVWSVMALMVFPVCGAGWGLAQVMFGLSIDAIGIGLAFSIVLGISAAVGSLIPLIRLQRVH